MATKFFLKKIKIADLTSESHIYIYIEVDFKNPLFKQNISLFFAERPV